MKPFEDSISEENTPPYQNLTILLQQATPGVSVTVEEQSQMLARVRSRLHQTDTLTSEGNVGKRGSLTLRVPAPPVASLQAGVRTQGDAPTHRRRRFSRMRYTLNMIAAVLVVAIIAGASLWLFSARRSSSSGGSIPTGAPVGAMKPPVMVRSEVDGLEATLQVTAGPYFLSELLAATVTLTNHSNKTVFLQGSDAPPNTCTSAFSLVTTGGSEPHYDFSLNTVLISCPAPHQIKIDSGKTVTSHGYIPLTKSGHVTLVPSARVSTVIKDSSGLNGIVSDYSPLDGHWPVIHISVAPKIPQDRTLSLRQQNSTVIINAPAVVAHALVYYYVVKCVGTIGTSAQWYPITSLILHEPGCSGANVHWTYAVGAPGYAIASGEMS